MGSSYLPPRARLQELQNDALLDRWDESLEDELRELQKGELAQGIVSRFMLFVTCDKSKILHCKKAWSNNDMRFLQWCLNIKKLDGIYHKNSARTQHSCPIHLMPKKNICPLYAQDF